ncbi:MAG: 5'-nucleotidase SurE [Acidimicrobiia bacterium]
MHSPGLAALAEVAAEFGEVHVVAPDAEQSSMSHAITASRPLLYRPARIASSDAYRVNGTPADCVALGTDRWSPVDVVLSGINLGFNIGNAIWHSGTLAAAKQAALFGVRGIALSSPGDDVDYAALKPWVRRVLGCVLADTSLRLVNVNIPREPRGMIWTHVSVRLYDGHIVPMKDPYDREVFWYAVKPVVETESGTDRWAVERNWVSLSPLRLDLTDGDGLRRARAHTPLDDARAHEEVDAPAPESAVKQVHRDEAQPAGGPARPQ